jgi:hypothetical protein
MTNTEICNAIHEIRMARQDYIKYTMKEYDFVMHRKIVELQVQCTHGKYSHHNNGIGHYWKECIYCGHREDEDE